MQNYKMYMHRYLVGKLRKIYFMALPESKQDMKSSRIYFTTADSAAQTITQLAGGTFIAALLTHSGISDSHIGIITSLVSLAALSQLFLINIFKRIKKYKLLVCSTALVRSLFGILFLIPLFKFNSVINEILMIILYFTGQIFVQIASPASQDWIASLVPSRLRGKYFSIKDSVVVFVISVLMLVCAVALDFYEKSDIVTGFTIMSIVIFLLTIINFVALSKMKEPKTSYLNENGKEMHGRLAKRVKESEEEEKAQSIISEIKEAFQNHRFRKFFKLQCIYILAFYICIPFNSSYLIKDMALPYTFIMLVTFFVSLYRVYFMPRLGRMADRYGMAKILRFTMLSLGLNFLCFAITMPFNAYPMYILSSIFNSTAWSFINIGLFGIQLDFFKSEKRMIWLTITSSISGLFGFIASIIGGILLSFLQKQDLQLFGQKIYAQQILNLIGFLIILIVVYYIKHHIETEKVDINRQDGRI